MGTGSLENMMDIDEKLGKLKGILAETGGVVVAFSGGVDSTFLLAVAGEVLGPRAIAVTADSPSYPRSELERARELATGLGVKHLVIETDEMDDPCFTANPPDRCYHCKSHLFTELLDIARENGIDKVADGQNADDTHDFRPGARAGADLGVISPLKLSGMAKDDIRELSRRMGLATADLPASACLASRLPYGEEITSEILSRIEAAEEFLKAEGFPEVRVRAHGEVARIEVAPSDVDALAAPGARERIASKLHEVGFSYVTVDLDGYRTGSMNEVLSAEIKK